MTKVVLSVFSRGGSAIEVGHGSLTSRVNYIPDRVGCIVASHFAPRRNCEVRDHENNKKYVCVAHTSSGGTTIVTFVGDVNGRVSRHSTGTGVCGLGCRRLVSSGDTGVLSTTVTRDGFGNISRRVGGTIHTERLGRVLLTCVD